MTPSRTAEFIKPILLFFLSLFILHFIYSMIMRDEDDDSFSVTITYDCKAVLENRNYYQGQLVDMCEELRRSL